MQDTITIRRGTRADASMLAELGAKTFHDTFASSNTKEDMALYLGKNFTIQRLEDELKEEKSTFLVAEHNGTTVGYAKLRNLDHPEELRKNNNIELERIYAIKEYLGKQVGKTLMDACLDLAKQLGHNVIWLGVWEHNPRAISFYEKMGFEKFATHPFMLGNDLQTDLLMKKNLT